MSIKSKLAPDVYGPNGVGYANISPDAAMADIGISIMKKGKGEKCAAGDWTTVHWKASLKDGRVVSDSHSEPGGLPKTFNLGKSEVFKCWDLAIT